MDSKPIVKKVLRSPSLKRKTKSVPVTQRVTLEKVLGLTLTKNAGLACDPNTGTIAYPAGCVIVLFNPRRNKQTHIFNSAKKTLTTVAFSRDGKHLVSGENGHQPAVRVWDVEEKTQVAQFLGHKFGINCVVFSPNLKYIVSVGSQHDMMVNVWNWKTNSKVKSNKVSSKVNAVAFSEDGSYFVTVGNRHVKFWYLENLKSKVNETVPLLGRSGILGDQRDNFFCDVVCGQGATASSTYCITQSGLLCEFNSKRLLDKWVELRTATANCISVGQDHIFIGCSGGVVRVFDCQSLRFITTLPKPHCLGVDVAAATSPSHMVCQDENVKYPDTIALVTDTQNNKITCVYNDHSLYIWDVRDLKKVGKAWSFLFHSSCIWGVQTYPSVSDGHTPVLPPGSFITCSSDDTIRVWNLDPHMAENTSYKHNIYSHELLKILYVDPTFANICDVNYNPAGNKDKTDTNYDGKNGIRAIKVSPDGQHLASGDRLGNVRIHDLQFMEHISTIEAHDGEVLSLEYSNFTSGPRLLSSTSRDRLVHVFDVEQNYGLIQSLDDHSSSVSAVKFTEMDHTLKMLSCGADKSLLFRNAVLSPSFQFALNQHLVGKTTLYDMDIDPTRKYVATACQDRNVRIYNIRTAKQKKCYKGSLSDDGVLSKVHLDPSGSYVATCCTDKNLCILDFYTGDLLATMFGHSEIAMGVHFTNDLKHLISTGAEGCIFVWRLPSDFTKQMRSRLEELGRMPKELKSSTDNDRNRGTFTMPKPIVFDQTDSNEFFPVFKESDFKSPEKILDALDKVDEIPSRDTKSGPNVSGPSKTDYRFSVGPLPKWAKTKVNEENSDKKGEDNSSGGQARGRWAQRVDTTGITVKSMLDGNQAVELATDDRRFTYEADALRRETMVIAKPETPPVNMPIITADDENNIEDDDDFLPVSFGINRNLDRSGDFDRSLNMSRGSDPPGLNHKWTSRRSLLVDGDDADDEETDSDTREVIYYPPSDAEMTDANSNSYNVFAISSNELKEGKSKLRRSGIGTESGSIKDGDSENTDPLSLEDVEEESDDLPSLPTTPLEPEKDFTPSKSRFVQDNIENLNFTPVSTEKFTSSLDDLEQELSNDGTSRIFSPRLSISARFLIRAGGNLRNVARQDNWFDSVQKRKDDMARAVDETRRKLESLGWGGDQTDQPVYDQRSNQPVYDQESNQPVYDQRSSERRARLSTLPDPYFSPIRLNPTEFSSDSPTRDNRNTMADKRKTPPSSPARSLSVGKGDNSGTPNHGNWRSNVRPSIRRSWSTTDLSKQPIEEGTSSNLTGSSLKDSAKYVSTFELRPTSITEELSHSGRPSSHHMKPPTQDRRDSGQSSFLSRRGNSEKNIPSEVAAETADKPRLYTRSQRHSADQHSYLKPTQSSRAKIAKAASSSNLTKKDGSKSNLTGSTGDLSKSASSLEELGLSPFSDEDSPKAQFDNKRHSLSRLLTVSVPNLATCFEEEDDEEEEESTNLRDLADLSKSVPEFMDADETSSSMSDNSSVAASEPVAMRPMGRSSFSSLYSSRAAMRDSSRKVNQWNTRRSMPGDIAGSKPAWSKSSGHHSVRSGDDFDKFTMPPPSKTQVVRTSFLRKAAHAKRRSAPDLTLEQAKNILLGKSGILGKSFTEDSNLSKSRGDSRTMELESEYPETGTVSSLAQQFSVPSAHKQDKSSSYNGSTSTKSSRYAQSSAKPSTSWNHLDHQLPSKDTTNRVGGDGISTSTLDASPIEPPVRDQPNKTSVHTSQYHRDPSLHNGPTEKGSERMSSTAGSLSPPCKDSSKPKYDTVNHGTHPQPNNPTKLPSYSKTTSTTNGNRSRSLKTIVTPSSPSSVSNRGRHLETLNPSEFDSPEKDETRQDEVPAHITPNSENTMNGDRLNNYTSVTPSFGNTNVSSPSDYSFQKQSTPVTDNASSPNFSTIRQLSTGESPVNKPLTSLSKSPAPSPSILRKTSMFNKNIPNIPSDRQRSSSIDKLPDDSSAEFDEISSLTMTPSKLRSRQGGGVVLPWQTNGRSVPPHSDSGLSSDTDESEPKQAPRRLPMAAAPNQSPGLTPPSSPRRPELSAKPKMALPTIPTLSPQSSSMSQRRSVTPVNRPSHTEKPSPSLATAIPNHRKSPLSVTIHSTSAGTKAGRGAGVQAGNISPSKPDKSQLTLPIQASASVSQEQKQMNKEQFTECGQAIKDMREALRKVTQMYEQVYDGEDRESKKMAGMLSQSFRDIQKTLADVASKTPGASARMFIPIAPTPEEEVATADKSLNTSDSLSPEGDPPTDSMNKAISMFQPILEQYSNRLTDKVYNLIQRRLDSSTPSSSSDT